MIAKKWRYTATYVWGSIGVSDVDEEKTGGIVYAMTKQEAKEKGRKEADTRFSSNYKFVSITVREV